MIFINNNLKEKWEIISNEDDIVTYIRLVLEKEFEKIERTKDFIDLLDKNDPSSPDPLSKEQQISFLANSGLSYSESEFIVNNPPNTSSDYFHRFLRDYEIDEGTKVAVESSKSLLKKYSDVLENVVIKKGPLESLNAAAIPFKNGKDLIVLNYGIVWLTWWIKYLMILDRLYLSEVSVSGDETKDMLIKIDILSSMPELAKHILNSPDKDDELTKHALTSKVIASVDIHYGDVELRSTFIKMFIILHEYAHIILGHTNWLNRYLCGHISLDSKEISIVLHRFEYEADIFALNNLMKQFPPDKEVFNWLYAYFSLIHCSEINQSDKLIQKNRATHPSPNDRFCNVLKVFNEHIPFNIDGEMFLSDLTKRIQGSYEAQKVVLKMFNKNK